MSTENTGTTEKGKKRKGNFKKEQPDKRIKGETYLTYKNKEIPAKISPTFEDKCKCKYECNGIEKEVKTSLFEKFYSKCDENLQKQYVLGLIEILPVTRRRHGMYNDSSESRRQNTVSYTVPDNTGRHRQVCRNTFMAIFQITSNQISTLIKRKKEGVSVYEDKRGGKTYFKFTDTDKDIVKQHIKCIPTDVSHYSRKKSGDKEYLSGDLNLHRLWKAFLEKYPTSNITYKFYKKIFKEFFPNLRFRKPRVDTCKICDRLNVFMKCKDKVQSMRAKTHLELHQRKAEAAFNAMKTDCIESTQPGSNNCTITIDLQKVFTLPYLTHSNMYYCRQLGCYNFGIHINDTADGIMCLWHEGEGSRGGNEMASCLLQAINDINLNMTYKKSLTIWSDNCCGQIKNKMMIYIYILLVSLGIFDRIDHKFLQVGHSFSAADRDFAIIEKRWKVSRCQVPDDVGNVIVDARPSKPFKLLKMGGKFLDINNSASKLINTSKIQITKASWLRVDKNKPGCVSFKTNFNEITEWTTFKVLNKGIKIEDLVQCELLSFADKIELPANKKKDLLTMIDYLCEENKKFYLNLCA